jgi:catalase
MTDSNAIDGEDFKGGIEKISRNRISPTKFETVPADEESQIREIAALTVQLMKQRYTDTRPLRNVHPKDHGCVKASFAVNRDIPDEYRRGIFSEAGRVYAAMVRFSNATASIQSDVGADGQASSRGFAIKIFDVEGEMLLPGPKRTTQDFLMINLPVFAFADVAEYLDLTRIQLENKDNVLPFFAGAPDLPPGKLKSFSIVRKIAGTQVANPVDTEYFTASPFLMGSGMAAKFSVKPRQLQNTPMPASPSPNFLREALTATLDEKTGKTVVFDFRVQVRNSDALEIEDATFEWPESQAPFVNIATVTIEPQNFNTPEREQECDEMVLTPWHGLKDHQPLGGINRLRKAAYLASSKLRREGDWWASKGKHRPEGPRREGRPGSRHERGRHRFDRGRRNRREPE